MAEIVYVRCDNGSVMPHDLPLPSGIADRVGRGDLRLVNADGSEITAEPEPEADPDAVPVGTVAAVLGWVGDDRERAARALEVEAAAEKPRTTLVGALEALATEPEE